MGDWYPGPVHVIKTHKIRATKDLSGSYERVHAHVIVVPSSGSGQHQVDFDDYAVKPGVIAHIQPGQVMRWLPDQSFEADVVLVRPEVEPPDLFVPWEPHVRVELNATAAIVASLVSELERQQEVEPSNEALIAALARALMQAVASEAPSETAAASRVSSSRRDWLLAFRRELERSFATAHEVHAYAAAVGVSTRTLNRVTRDLVGQTAKEIIDARLSLEAQRRLALTTDSSQEIAFRLGFSEATNFSRFFQRLTGTTPHEFRESSRR